MPGISPSYRIGPSDFFLPSDLLADGNTLNNQINRLNDQDWEKPSQNLFDAFQVFLSEWRSFYSSMGFFSALNNSNRDQLIQFETRFIAFVDKYQNEGGENVPDVVEPSSGTKDGLGDHIVNQLQPLVPGVNVTVLIIAVIVGFLIYIFGQGFIAKKVVS